MKKLQVLGLALLTTVFLGSSVSAHIVVKPGDVAIGAFQTFTVGVPNEKEGSVIKVKLDIPTGVTSVTPTVKQGWTIETEKEGEGETAVVKSITWSGGSIGSNLRDDFTFSAKTPDQATDLQWNAYETYDNGLTIAWDKSDKDQPKKADGSPDFSKTGPFSLTKVTADGGDAAAITTENTAGGSGSDTIARTLAGAALLVAIVTFALATRPKRTTK